MTRWKQDLSMTGGEVVQAIAEIPAGMNAGRHTPLATPAQ